MMKAPESVRVLSGTLLAVATLPEKWTVVAAAALWSAKHVVAVAANALSARKMVATRADGEVGGSSNY